jgi:type IV secretion system protein VirD4
MQPPYGTPPLQPQGALARLLSESEYAGHGIYLGTGEGGHAWARPEQGVLVLGPPRSGKTATIVVPNILAACGPVVAASTKPDLLHITAAARAHRGRCLVFDPSGTVQLPPAAERVGWSPLLPGRTWDGSLLVANTMVRAARPGADHGDAVHWTERAISLLAVSFHAGALGRYGFGEVMSAIDRHDLTALRRPLAEHDATRALDLLNGVAATDPREQSGIWSTASEVLAGYRTDGALASTGGVMLDSTSFLSEPSTLYICAGSDQQRQAAPVVAGVLRDLRTQAYENRAAALAAGGPMQRPMLFALDELANIAPLHDLPMLVAEGGSQGVLTLACLQDLSQGVARWGREAEGFFSLFGSKVVFPGIGDTRTLEAISLLAGEVDRRVLSDTRSGAGSGILGRRGTVSRTTSLRRERRLPVDVIARGSPGTALCLDGTEPGWVWATPWFATRELRDIVVPSLAGAGGITGAEERLGRARGTGAPLVRRWR